MLKSTNQLGNQHVPIHGPIVQPWMAHANGDVLKIWRRGQTSKFEHIFEVGAATFLWLSPTFFESLVLPISCQNNEDKSSDNWVPCSQLSFSNFSHEICEVYPDGPPCIQGFTIAPFQKNGYWSFHGRFMTLVLTPRVTIRIVVFGVPHGMIFYHNEGDGSSTLRHRMPQT